MYRAAQLDGDCVLSVTSVFQRVELLMVYKDG